MSIIIKCDRCDKEATAIFCLACREEVTLGKEKIIKEDMFNIMKIICSGVLPDSGDTCKYAQICEDVCIAENFTQCQAMKEKGE